ncbi:MAG TPA: hypothetical protein VGQ57_11180, partial [Polyangiaceae bacterium]|nr:hypothetical protein [Polyangiaceae bacterium]
MRRSTSTRGLWGGVLAALVGLVAATGCGNDASPCSGAECGGSSGSGGTGATGSQSGPCSSDATCDLTHGFSCVAGQCRHPCSTHFDCEGYGLCDSVKAGDGSSLGTYCAL